MKALLTNTLFCPLVLFAISLSAQEEIEFQSIFDGKTLEGWKAKDMSYWSIEDGAITGQSSEEHPCTKNQFIVWQGGDVGDFELKLQFRVKGNGGNSGVQFRSRIREDGLAVGYQADIVYSGSYLGGVCDEIHSRDGRELLTGNGSKTVIDADGKRTATDLGAKAEMKPEGEWNEYRITARGQHIILAINGVTSSELIDREKDHFDLTGVLGLQLRSGDPMKVQFKDIVLRQFKPGTAPAVLKPKDESKSELAGDEISLFDGKSLKGWSAPNMSYWSVRDSAITAQSTEDNPARSNQTLAWTGGEPSDFELKLKFRLGDNKGNSGVQVRSKLDDDGTARGYQADILPGGTHCGAIWDESTGRNMLAQNGQKVIIDASGGRHVTSLGKTVALKPAGEWNDCHITARGHHIIVRFNGQVCSEVIDSETGEFDLKGIVGFQLRAGHIMTAQFKDIRLTSLHRGGR